MELREVLLQLTAVVGNGDPRGNVDSFQKLLWNLPFAVLVAKEHFLVGLDHRRDRTETKAL